MSPSSTEIRVAFFNTWLLRPRLGPGGPVLPFGERLFAPDVVTRATLVGSAVRDRFDIVACSEVFEPIEQRAVADSWPDAHAIAGPARGRRRLTGSGLLTLVSPEVTITRTASHAYASGGDWRDSDTFATKGALLTSVRLGDGAELDVVSTHLVAGGDLLPIPGHDDTVRHHRDRMAQVDELVTFVEDHRRTEVPVLVLGDFNVAAWDPEPRLADPHERHRDLAERLGRLGCVDLWAAHGVGPGSTCTFGRPEDLPPDPGDPDLVADDPSADPASAPGERIDYLWLAQAGDGRSSVVAERPRRWAFPGRGARGGPAGSLSDHLVLSVTLHIEGPEH